MAGDPGAAKSATGLTRVLPRHKAAYPCGNTLRTLPAADQLTLLRVSGDGKALMGIWKRRWQSCRATPAGPPSGTSSRMLRTRRSRLLSPAGRAARGSACRTAAHPARLFAQGLRERHGQLPLIESRASAGGIAATGKATRTEPDSCAGHFQRRGDGGWVGAPLRRFRRCRPRLYAGDAALRQSPGLRRLHRGHRAGLRRLSRRQAGGDGGDQRGAPAMSGCQPSAFGHTRKGAMYAKRQSARHEP